MRNFLASAAVFLKDLGTTTMCHGASICKRACVLILVRPLSTGCYRQVPDANQHV